MIVLGRIVAPFGIQGWVKIHPFGDDPLSWRKMPEWWLAADDSVTDASGWQARKLRGCRAHGKGLVVAFDGIEDRNGAEALTGQYVAAPREALPKPDKDEYYWADLVGLNVENPKGESLGAVASLVETGAHAVMEIVAGEGESRQERLIPFVAAYVKDVDVAGRRIVVEWELDW
ncbi:MAG: ribosome maturation factor RimM [Moraxellaceae bacterium]|nr:ribosome maturation factor RimM [Moraxellaceae bacterium]